MPHESVIPTTLFCSFGGVSLKFSKQTRGRLESEKPCTGRAPVGQLVQRRAVMREVVSLTPTRATLRVLK